MVKKVDAYELTHVEVNCKRNDIVDIKCGGPAVLGFDFYIDPNTFDEVKEYIEKVLKENDIPLMSIRNDGTAISGSIWNKEMIKTCIQDSAGTGQYK